MIEISKETKIKEIWLFFFVCRFSSAVLHLKVADVRLIKVLSFNADQPNVIGRSLTVNEGNKICYFFQFE